MPKHELHWERIGKRSLHLRRTFPSCSRDEDISNSLSMGGCNVPITIELNCNPYFAIEGLKMVFLSCIVVVVDLISFLTHFTASHSDSG